MATTITRPAIRLAALPIGWPLLVALTLAITYANGFWLTALQGVVGAVERFEPPFTRWLRDSTLMLPLVALALLLGLLAARRLLSGRRALARLAGLAALATLIGSGVGLAGAAVSALRDYQIQAEHIELIHAQGGDQSAQALALDGSALGSSASYSLFCSLSGASAQDAISLLQYATFLTHMRALAIYAGLTLATNLLLVAGLLFFAPARLQALPPR